MKFDELHCVKDEDVFLLNCPKEMGTGSEGIACVILSILSRDNDLCPEQHSFEVTSSDFKDFSTGNFEYITSCYPHESEMNSGAKFYINFQVWVAGKIDVDNLHKRLMDSIRDALWDFNLEFKIFKFCSFDECGSCFNSLSEPSTPKKTSDLKERRSGLSVITGFKLMHSASESHSNPQLASTKSSNQNQQASGPVHFTFSEDELAQKTMSEKELKSKNADLFCLTNSLNKIIKPWLDFGREIRVPSLKRYQFSIILKSSLFVMIKEFNNFIKNYNAHMKIHFLTCSALNDYQELDLSEAKELDLNKKILILIRHENLWNAKELHKTETSFTQQYHKFKNETITLNFMPHFTSSTDQITRCIAPRQKFLLLHIEDRYLTLYMYNWANESKILVYFSFLVIWHNARSLLLQSLILQKAGIMHNLPFCRYKFDDILNLSTIKTKNFINSSTQTLGVSSQPFAKGKQSLNLNIFSNIDLLLKHTDPYRASEEDPSENLQIKNTIHRYLFEVPVYPLIFKPFHVNMMSKKDLFECFQEQYGYGTYKYYSGKFCFLALTL